ncbi:MAG TPA: hypothetical protein VIB62_10080 [Actinomycetota bacterium]|jgi:hypothetical protein
MPGLERVPPDVRTVHLGAYTSAHAVLIARELDERGIVWWTKEPGFLSRIWELGSVHVFVDRTKLDEAREIADGVLRAGGPGSG